MVSIRVEYLWEREFLKNNHTHKMSGPFDYPNIGVTQLDFLTSASLSHWMHTTPEKGISLGTWEL